MSESTDELYDDAVSLVVEHQRPNFSFLQRKLRIGYVRADRLLQDMERNGVVSKSHADIPRKVLKGKA